MLISYRRTGGVGALLALVVIGLAAGMLTAAVAVIAVVVGLAVSGVLLLRAVLPGAWRRRGGPAPTASAATDWPHATIEGTVVDTAVSSHPRPDRAEAVPPLVPDPARARRPPPA